jgi:hypothetical protein
MRTKILSSVKNYLKGVEDVSLLQINILLEAPEGKATLVSQIDKQLEKLALVQSKLEALSLFEEM